MAAVEIDAGWKFLCDRCSNWVVVGNRDKYECIRHIYSKGWRMEKNPRGDPEVYSFICERHDDDA